MERTPQALQAIHWPPKSSLLQLVEKQGKTLRLRQTGPTRKADGRTGDLDKPFRCSVPALLRRFYSHLHIVWSWSNNRAHTCPTIYIYSTSHIHSLSKEEWAFLGINTAFLNLYYYFAYNVQHEQKTHKAKKAPRKCGPVNRTAKWKIQKATILD
jgi:hypothetical protein